MEDKEINGTFGRDYSTLFSSLLKIVNSRLESKYIAKHEETKRLFLASPEGTLLKSGIVSAIIIKKIKSNPPRKKSDDELLRSKVELLYSTELDFLSRERAKTVIKLLEAIAEFIKEEFSITLSADRQQKDHFQVILTFY